MELFFYYCLIIGSPYWFGPTKYISRVALIAGGHPEVVPSLVTEQARVGHVDRGRIGPGGLIIDIIFIIGCQLTDK